MSSSAALLANNAHYVATRPASHNVVSQKIPGECLIIACMDSRVNVERMFGLEIGLGGAQAGVIRCAGGHPQGVMRSVLFVQLLAGVKEIMVLQHTHCGGLFVTDEKVRPALNHTESCGGPWKDAAPKAATEFYLGGFRKPGETDEEGLERSVREDVRFLREHPLVKAGIVVSGYVHELETGRVRKVEY